MIPEVWIRQYAVDFSPKKELSRKQVAKQKWNGFDFKTMNFDFRFYLRVQEGQLLAYPIRNIFNLPLLL